MGIRVRTCLAEGDSRKLPQISLTTAFCALSARPWRRASGRRRRHRLESCTAVEYVIPLTRRMAQDWAAEARRREAEEAERKQIRELEREVKREARLQVSPPATRALQPCKLFRCVCPF